VQHTPHEHPSQVKVKLRHDWPMHRCKGGDVVVVFWRDWEYLHTNGLADRVTEHTELMDAARKDLAAPGNRAVGDQPTRDSSLS